ncbi:MAG: response regulator transcription factor [Bacteroidia bacterium]
MDIDMPVVSGIYACNEIKRVSPDTLVFFVTMITQIETVLSALKAGADAYVLKGNSLEDLAEAFDYSVKKKRPFVSQQLRHLVSIDKKDFQDKLITDREKNILKMICEGMTNDEIANVINISVRTVDTHRQNMLNKLKLPNTAALVRFAIENKLI